MPPHDFPSATEGSGGVSLLGDQREFTNHPSETLLRRHAAIALSCWTCAVMLNLIQYQHRPANHLQHRRLRATPLTKKSDDHIGCRSLIITSSGQTSQFSIWLSLCVAVAFDCDFRLLWLICNQLGDPSVPPAAYRW